MTSYAPLFARKDGTQWNPDMIYYDNERPFLTCSYYVQQLFGQSSGNYWYGDCVKFEGDAADAIRQLFVKICNASAEQKKANIDLSRFGVKKMATKTVLAGQPNDENNFEAQPIAPKTEQVKAQKKFSLDIAPYSFVMLQYQL